MEVSLTIAYLVAENFSFHTLAYFTYQINLCANSDKCPKYWVFDAFLHLPLPLFLLP